MSQCTPVMGHSETWGELHWDNNLLNRKTKRGINMILKNLFL